MRFFLLSSDSADRRRNSMSSKSFQAIRRLQETGAPLPLVLANPAWQMLLDKVDSNIAERSALLQNAISKLPLSKRPISSVNNAAEFSSKRQRTDDLAARKEALISTLDHIQDGQPSQDESYEQYRRQCWEQYYEWMEQQKNGGNTESGRAPATIPVASSDAPSSPDEDEEIHNALLGLS